MTWLALTLYSSTAAAIPPEGLGDLLVTEVQADTNAVAPYYGEWVEVYNNAGHTLDLNGLVIESSGFTLTIPAGPPVLTVDAGGYFVFGASDNTALNGGVQVDYSWDEVTSHAFNLSLADDILTLTYEGVVLDEVDWDSTWGWQASPDSAHQVQPSASSNEWANGLLWNWCSSTTIVAGAIKGTPGEENEQCGDEYNVDNDGDGYAEFQGDCDDEHADINPDAIDGVADPYGVADDDADCDGVRDDGITDDDGDGWTEVDGDCDDEEIGTYPGAVEALDGQDNDCDGCEDDVDYDRDGWTVCKVECDSNGDGVIDASDSLCYDCKEAPEGATQEVIDACAEYNPDAADVPYDGNDQDCDGFDECDVDGDGYTATSAAGAGCDGYDCNDGDAAVHPGAPEDIQNGIDDDCDGVVDLPDRDGDGFTGEGGDCMDLDAETYPAAQVALSAQVYPGATEVCFDQVDNDCDGFIDNLPACTRGASTARVRGGGLCGVGDGGANSLLALLALGTLTARRARRNA